MSFPMAKINPLQAQGSTIVLGVMWKHHAHQAMLKGGQGFSSGMRRLTNKGARLLTCKCKRTGDTCHKDQGDEGYLLKGHRMWRQHSRHTLLQISSHRSLGSSSTLFPSTGCGSLHNRYCKTAQSQCFPFPGPAGNSYEGASIFREWTLPFAGVGHGRIDSLLH